MNRAYRLVGIRTRFHGPTNTSGARMTATTNDGARRRCVSVPYDHGLDLDENHATAARAFLARHVAPLSGDDPILRMPGATHGRDTYWTWRFAGEARP